MNILLPLFLILGTIWFATQLFGATAVAWTAAIVIGLWALLWVVRFLKFLVAQEWHVICGFMSIIPCLTFAVVVFPALLGIEFVPTHVVVKVIYWCGGLALITLLPCALIEKHREQKRQVEGQRAYEALLAKRAEPK